jgi:hypothetical protein
MGAGNLPSGSPVTPATGSAVLAVPRDCRLLGFMVSVSGAILIYDSATAAGAAAGNQVLSITPVVLGWYPFPIEIKNGLVVNCAASTTFVTA